jgi:hypothetical protein
MREKETNKLSGWLVGLAALVLTAVFAISGAPRAQARVPEISKASVSASSASSVQPGDARADSDTCDLQLD